MDNNVSGLNADVAWSFNGAEVFEYYEDVACPNLGEPVNPCWVFCSGNIVRHNSTIGYQNVSLEYSITPYITNNGYVCIVSWSNDSSNWHTIDQQYDQDTDIVDQKVSLGTDASNQPNIFIMITAIGTNIFSNTYPCCGMAEFTLSGIPVTAPATGMLLITLIVSVNDEQFSNLIMILRDIDH